MNIKRLFILTGTVLLGLTMVSMWLMFLSAPPESARAAGPWYVAPGGSDSNTCLSTGAPCANINGAIGKASGGDTIYVATGTYTGTGDEVVLINKDITLSGGWDASFTTQSGTSTIDGEEWRRGIDVNSDVTVTVDYFTIQNGNTDFVFGDGGGIDNHGNLTLTNSIVSGNTADWFEGGNGGGINNHGNLTLTNSIVSNNTAKWSGGGICGQDGSSNTIIDSQIYGNTAGNGSGGGIEIPASGNLSLSRSWVVANAAHHNDGGGIYMDAGTSSIENSIIAGNTMDSTGDTGGGLFLGEEGPHRIINSHIVGNHAAGKGAAIATFKPVQVQIINTLVISNTGITGIDDKYGSGSVYLLNYCDTYHNSPDGTTGVTITRNNCLGSPQEDGLDPMMAGGALPSGVGPDYADEWLNYDYQLLPGSPAIDAGTPVDAPATDIEGNPRDATPDLGAYEGGVPFIITGITPNTAIANTGNLLVTITGINLATPISAQLDGVPLLNPTLASDTTLNAVVPVNSLDLGVYDLTVTIDGEIDTLHEAFTVGAEGPWYVAPSGDDADDCLSPATPCETINGALNKPGFLDDSTILVATGVYTDIGEEVVQIDKRVTLHGGWNSTFTTQSGTSIIDGEETRRGVSVNDNVNATINGFTIQNGFTTGDGGGIDSRGPLTLTHSIVRDNTADTGGGIYVGNSRLFLDSSIVSGNTATDGEGGGFKLGGGERHLMMLKSWVVGNAALSNDAGGISFGGDDGSAYIENSIIAGNTSADSAGGLQFGPGGPYRIVNSHIVGNYTSGEGAAIATYEPVQVALTNTLVISNTGITGIDDMKSSGSVFLLNYCDTFGNSPDGTIGVTITRNDCLGSPPVDGLDPMMSGGALPSGLGPDYADEWLSYDYRLLPGSPAIDAGTDAGVKRDIDNQPRPYQAPDLGAYEYWPPGVLKYIYLPLVMK